MVDKNKINWEGWETVRLIGSGSFGSVFEVQRKTGDIVEKAAIKKISIPQNDNDIEEMYNEGYDAETITCNLDAHKNNIIAEYNLMREMRDCTNIVSCDDIKCEKHLDGIGWDIYIRMELLKPLTKWLAEDVEVLSDEIVEKFAKDMCNALKMCKKHNVVHRDIKPQNIFVSENGDFKLGDFGIAKTMEKTIGGTKIGTYKYMAPEVYNNQPYGHSADIYSLGLVLYWVLNERRMPFMPLPPEKPKANLEEESRTRRFSGEQLPEPANGNKKLKRIVLKACAFHPNDRYKSADEMLVDINNKVIIEDEKKDDLKKENTIAVFFKTLKAKVESLKNDLFQRKDKKDEKKKSKTIKIIAIILAILMALHLLFSYGWVILDFILFTPLPFDCDGSEISTEQTTINNESILSTDEIETTEDESSTTQTTEDNTNTSNADEIKPTEDESFTDKENNIPIEHLYWSEWLDELPKNISKQNYDIETRTLYSSREQKTTSSTKTNKMDGWELYDTVEAGAGYGSWSDWTDRVISGTNDRQVESKIFYRFRNKEITTSSSSNLSGWELYDSQTTYGTWSNVQSTATKPTESDTLQITGTWKQYHYYHYCNYYNNQWNIDSIAYGSSSVRHDTYLNQKLPAFSLPDQGGKQAYGGQGAPGVTACDYNFYVWFYAGEKTFYNYQTRSKTTTNYFYRWGNWSNWYYDSISETSTRQVESKKFYRYRDQIKTKTYYFKKWTDWTDFSTGVVTPSDTVQVKTKTQYRFKAKTT